MKKILIVILFLFPLSVSANLLDDADMDGVPDSDEINIYHTNPYQKDTDGDGYDDKQELISGYSPHNPKKVTLENNDLDYDGLSDRMELNFHSNLENPDSDGDGIKDGEEIKKGSDPNKKDVVLEKKIKIDLKNQYLSYFLGDVRLGLFKVSTGKKSMPTPTGTFAIGNKSIKAWSKKYGLWMPYWLGIQGEQFGIHELPVWPGGYREGANHLGIAVSHGCVRLGIGPAKELYDWTSIGTKVIIN